MVWFWNSRNEDLGYRNSRKAVKTTQYAPDTLGLDPVTISMPSSDVFKIEELLKYINIPYDRITIHLLVTPLSSAILEIVCFKYF